MSGLRNSLTGLLFALIALTIGTSCQAEDELQQRESLLQTGRLLARSEAFQQLELLHSVMLRDHARTSSGTWRVYYLDRGVSSYIRTLVGITCREPKEIKLFSDWEHAIPGSDLEHVMYADALIGAAYCHRGNKYSVDVKPSEWVPYKALISAAKTHLERYATAAKTQPLWYVERISTVIDLGSDYKDVIGLVEAGVRTFPAYHDIYYSGVVGFLPRYGGQEGQLDHFLRWSDTLAKKEEGKNVIYARAYWNLTQTLGDNPLEGTGLDWEIVRQGLAEIDKTYPSEWNRSNFARLACLAGDRQFAKRYLVKYRSASEISKAWESMNEYSRCVSFTDGV